MQSERSRRAAEKPHGLQQGDATGRCSRRMSLRVGRQYGGDYVAAEEAAHAARRGIWAGEFEMPAQWRRERKISRLLEAPPLTVPALGADQATLVIGAYMRAWK
jgi:hypothetical protein